MKINSKQLVLSLIAIIFLFSSTFAKEIEKDSDVKRISPTKTAQQKTTPAKSSGPDQDIKKGDVDATSLITNPQPNNPALANPAAGEQINWQVLSSGGGTGISTNYILSGTVGQVATGWGISTNYKVHSGFWQDFASSIVLTCCVGFRGNVDASLDDIIDIDDVVYLVDYAFGFPSGPPPPCEDAPGVYPEADVDATDLIDIDDVVYLVDYAFGFPSGPQPADCP